MMVSARRRRQRQVQEQEQQETPVPAEIDDDVYPPESQRQQKSTRKKNRFKLFSRRHHNHHKQQQQQELPTAPESNVSEAIIRDSSGDDTSGLPLHRLLSNQRKAFLVYQQRRIDDQKSLEAIQKLMLQVPIAAVPADVPLPTKGSATVVVFHEDETSASTLGEEDDPRNDIDITEHHQQYTYTGTSTQQQSIEQQQHQHQHQQPHDDGEEYILRRRADGDEKLARFLTRPLRTEKSNIDSNSKSNSNSKILRRQSTTKSSSTSSSIGSFRTNNRRLFRNNTGTGSTGTGTGTSRTAGRHDSDLLQDQDQTRQPSKPQRVVVVFCQCCYRDIAPAAAATEKRSLTCSAVIVEATNITTTADDSTTTVDGKLLLDNNSNDASHSFCTDCVKRYVESWLFGGAYYTLRERKRDTTTPHRSSHAAVDVGALPCLSGTCTEGWFTDDTVSRVVSAKVAQQYQEKLVSLACVIAVSSTPNSNPLPSSDESSNVNVNSNVKLDKKKLLEQSYRQAEEALTYAKMRQCPYCKVSFLKESDSCNKMTCPSCRNTMCYICRKPVEKRGYEHFCQHSYDSCSQQCNKCPLWTLKDDARDREHLRQVAVEHANRVWEESLLRDDQHEIRLDVDKLLGGGYVYCREIGATGNTERVSKTAFEI
jgi:hypothetical protein